ncbi:MAG TPA: response regulator [Candidatus Saccharimonadales bacterium]|nr:response regulator [Candidatus Saccharimonadales bacterium]
MAKILIVEDEKALNEAYELILKKEGHQVETSFNGQEALDKCKKLQPDLILLDLRMPKMDGVEFLKELQPAKRLPDVKIIVFSNYDSHEEIDSAFELGATRYILKAWSSPAELVKVVNETLAGREQDADDDQEDTEEE